MAGDLQLTDYYQRASANPILALRDPRQGVQLRGSVAASEILLVAVGACVRPKTPGKRRKLRHLQLGEEIYLTPPRHEWDGLLIGRDDSILRRDKHQHFMRDIAMAVDAQSANVHWSTSPSGHPVLRASADMAPGTTLRVFHEERPPYIALSRVQAMDATLEAEGEPLMEVHQEAERVFPQGRTPTASTAAAAKLGWLNLLVFNSDGNHSNPSLISSMVSRQACEKLHGLLMTDTRTPPSQVAHVKRAWELAFRDLNVIVEVLPGRPPADHTDLDDCSRNELVGGSTVCIFPTKYVTLRHVGYDPGRFGIVTRVTLGLGKTDSTVWMGVYVPWNGAHGRPTGLQAKVLQWLTDTQPGIKGTADHNAQAWTWRVIEDTIARSRLNRCHIGRIVMGDLNQAYEGPDPNPESLYQRTQRLGLYTSWAARADERGPEHWQGTYNTAGGKPTRIDHIYCEPKRGGRSQRGLSNFAPETSREGSQAQENLCGGGYWSYSTAFRSSVSNLCKYHTQAVS